MTNCKSPKCYLQMKLERYYLQQGTVSVVLFQVWETTDGMDGEEQIKLFKKGECVTVRNAKVNMVRGFIRLVVDKWGAIKPPGPTEKLQGPPKVENNISNIEYELV